MSSPPAPARLAPPAAARAGVGVLGATGYAGAELVRLLGEHPGAALRAAGSRACAGQSLSRVWPSLPQADLVLDEDPEEPGPWLDRGVEVVFSALPHGAFAARAPAFLAAGLRVVDLSSDFRPGGAAARGPHTGAAHPNDARVDPVYGLTEWAGPEVESARLVANPGCYATAALLAILPAAAGGWWSGDPIVVNALSGVSGAGRAASLATHFVECGGSASAYRVGETHGHLPEIRHALGKAGGPSGPIVFNPHLVPMARGILASAAVPLSDPVSEAEARQLYAARYRPGGFVRLLPEEELPETRHVRGSNRCDLALRVACAGRMLLIFAAIDNLLKGAAGQAVQNWNRMQGWPEPTGLPLSGWGPA